MQDFVESMREEGREADATLAGFLQDISLQTDKESDDGKEAKVSLMTVHAAKGLEFPTVFVVGMDENIFPSQMASRRHASWRRSADCYTWPSREPRSDVISPVRRTAIAMASPSSSLRAVSCATSTSGL